MNQSKFDLIRPSLSGAGWPEGRQAVRAMPKAYHTCQVFAAAAVNSLLSPHFLGRFPKSTF